MSVSASTLQCVSIVTIAVATVVPLGARADAQTDLRAQAAFDQGETLMRAGRYKEACDKYSESQALAPSGGTVLHLADCLDKAGKPAEALVFFEEAQGLAHSAGKADIEKYASDHITALNGRVSHVTVNVVDPAPSEEVRVDGVPMVATEWAKPRPLDPGDHELSARAAGKAPFTTRFQVAAGETRSVTIPALGTGSSGGAAQRWAGVAIGSVGVAGLIVGAVFGGLAKAKNDDALKNCRTPTLCSQTGLDLTKTALLDANISTGTLVAGGVLAGVGLTVLLTAPHASDGNVKAAQLRIGGAF